MTVYAHEEPFECAKAVKGEDFIRLYDEGGNTIAAFEGVSDFSAYTIDDGEWEAPKEELTVNDLMVAIERGLNM